MNFHCRAAWRANLPKYGEKVRSNAAFVTFPFGSTLTRTTTAGLPSMVFRAFSGIFGTMRRVTPFSITSLSLVDCALSDWTGATVFGADAVGAGAGPGATAAGGCRGSPGADDGVSVRRITTPATTASPATTRPAGPARRRRPSLTVRGLPAIAGEAGRDDPACSGDRSRATILLAVHRSAGSGLRQPFAISSKGAGRSAAGSRSSRTNVSTR